MLLHDFPDLQWLKNQAQTQFQDRKAINGMRLENPGWPTVILNTTTQQVVRDNIQGPLSIFTNRSGASNVIVDKRRVTVTPETFFISNSNQAYTLEIQEKTATETFNIHIGDHFSKRALAGFFSSPEKLLEDSSGPNVQQFGFHNRLIQSSHEFNLIVNEIQQGANDKLYLEENLYQLISLLLNEQQKVSDMRDRLNVVKASTRQEILKRMLIVADFLFTFYSKNPDLDELARISCLSKFHFLRLFKIAYGQTPHQFITDLKITKAKQLLKVNSEVGAIAHQLGFDTTSTFSRSFRNRTGVYPSQFRTLL
jgi:AraC family transcriptional regulator